MTVTDATSPLTYHWDRPWDKYVCIPKSVAGWDDPLAAPRPIGDIGGERCVVTARSVRTREFENFLPTGACNDSVAAIVCNPR